MTSQNLLLSILIMPPIILASDKISTLFGSFMRLLHYISKTGTYMHGWFVLCSRHYVVFVCFVSIIIMYHLRFRYDVRQWLSSVRWAFSSLMFITKLLLPFAKPWASDSLRQGRAFNLRFLISLDSRRYLEFRLKRSLLSAFTIC